MYACRKRKCDDVKKTHPTKKVKKELIVDCAIRCTICFRNFANSVSLHKHNELDHLPTIAAFGCSSCQETFITAEEKAIHHKWHQTAHVPYKCFLCAASFEKMITFHRHVAACAKALSASFIVKGNIDCDMCHFGFETQNLYEWHDCFIKKNAPCPKCGRVFTKKTILFKHLFKCNGIAASTSSGVVQIPKLTTTSKKRSTKSKTDTIPTFKLEPETIIETNLNEENDNDVFDGGYMDTHFGDSDDDCGKDASITASNKTQIQVRDPSRTKKQKTSTTVGKKCSNNPIFVHQLADCVVKLEPIDISQYIVNVSEPMDTTDDIEQMETTATNDEISVSGSIESLPPTVPPLTIRIKKEKINTGYGDFDAELARNIKKERTDETWELVGSSSQGGLVSQPNPVRQSVEKKSKKSKSNTLYKKPALLAIKIKQERIERETEVNTEDNYHDYSIPVVDMQAHPTPSIENLLPIITQIHSVLEPYTLSSIETNEQTRMLPNPFSGTQKLNQIAESIPFKPIRIVKQERLSPPLSESLDQIPDSTFTEPADNFIGIDEQSQPSEGDLQNCVSVAMHTESSTNSEDTPKPNETIKDIVISELNINCSSTQSALNVPNEEPTAKCGEINDSTSVTIVESAEVGSATYEAKICETATTANNSSPQIHNSESSLDSKDGNDVKVIDEAQQKNIEMKNDSQTVSVDNPKINSSDVQVEAKVETNLIVQAEQTDNSEISSSPNEILGIAYHENNPNDINQESDLNQCVIECEDASNTDQNVEAAIAEAVISESETTAKNPSPQINNFESSLDSTDGNNMIQKDEDISLEALESGLIDDDESLLLDGGITEESLLLDSNPESLLLSKDVQILEAVKDVLNTSSLDGLNDGDSNLNFIDRLVDKAAEEIIIGDDKNEPLDDLGHLIEITTPFNSSNGMETGIDNTQPCTSTESTKGNDMELTTDKLVDNDEILGLNIDYNELIPAAEPSTEILPQILNAMHENDVHQGDRHTQPNFEPSIDDLI